MRISDWSSDVCSSDRGSFPTGKDQSVSPSPACGVKACCLRAIGSRTPERPARCAGPGAERGGAEPGAPDEAALLPLAGEGGAQRRMRGGERSELLLLSFLPGRNAKIKSFRAVTARAPFLCLCKETWRKESTPRLRSEERRVGKECCKYV